MAKVTVTFDTETKELVADINGTVYTDVREVNLYKERYASNNDSYYCSVYLEPVEDDGITHRQSFHARASDLLAQGIKIYRTIKSKKHWLFN